MRKHLTNEMWNKLAPLLPPETGRQGLDAKDNRLMVEGMLWKMRTSSPWRGTCRKILIREIRSMRALVDGARPASGMRFFRFYKKRLTGEWLFLNSTAVRADQHAHGAKKKALPEGQAIARSRGGPTTKIHLICQGQGGSRFIFA